MDRKRFVLRMFPATMAALLLYVTLHEGGHAAVAAACGATITEFDIIGAHVKWYGANFTPVTESLCNAAGMLLPVAVGFAAVMALLRRGAAQGRAAAKCFAFAFYVMTAFSVLPWILFPAAGIFPEGEDITEFMASSALPRWAVSVGAVVLASLFVYTASKNGVFARFFAEAGRTKKRQ